MIAFTKNIKNISDLVLLQLYDKNGKFTWTWSLQNALLVIQEGYKYTNVYELLVNHNFEQELCFHSNFNSLINKNKIYSVLSLVNETLKQNINK